MGIQDDDIERLRSTVSIVDTIQQYVALKRVGRNWVGLCPFHAEKSGSFNVREETGRYKCFGCQAAGDVFTFVQEIEHLDFPGCGRTHRGEGRHPAHVHVDRPVEGAGAAQAAGRRDGAGGRVVPPAAAGRSRRPRRSRLPPPAGSGRRRRPPVQDRLGARRLGCPQPRPARASRGAAGHRAVVPQQAQQDAGLVPGPGDVPDLLRVGRGAGVRRAGAAGLGRSGEVQELGRDGDLQQVQDAVRTELGQGRHRQVRSGGGVRGLHRRDRFPPGRRAEGGGDVWHRARPRNTCGC